MLYRRSVLQDSQRRLYGLELFQFANIEPLNPELQPDEVPIRVTVAEGKHQRVNFGVGYGTEEKARVDAEYHHVNFLGAARLAGAHARWSSLDRGVRLDFNQPYFFAPRFSLGGDGQQWYTFTPAYQSIVTSAKLTVTHRTNERTSWATSLLSERNDSSISEAALNDESLRDDLIALGLDPDTGSQNGTSECVRLRPAALDGGQPAERAPRLPVRVPRRAGRRSCRARSTTTRCRSTAGTTCRSAPGLSWRVGCSSATSGRRRTIRATCRFRRSIFSAARPAFADGDDTK